MLYANLKLTKNKYFDESTDENRGRFELRLQSTAERNQRRDKKKGNHSVVHELGFYFGK